MKLKNINFTHENRGTILEYLEAKETEKAASTKAKKLKPKVEAIFNQYGNVLNDKSKSSFIGGFIQQCAQRIGVVYRKTWTSGTIDWKAYALDLGGNEQDAERYRKEGHWVTACDKATKEQQKELEERL